MKKYRNFILLIILAALLIVFILFSGTVVQSVKNSLLMCYNSIIPALFPFFILCGFLVRIISNMKVPVPILAFASSQVSGFPSGTKSVCELYGNKALDKKTASKMLLFTGKHYFIMKGEPYEKDIKNDPDNLSASFGCMRSIVVSKCKKLLLQGTDLH